MRWIAAAFLAWLGLVGAVAPAGADTAFKATGGSGDRSDPVICDPGTYVVGFRGRTGAWIDRVGPACVAIAGGQFWTPGERGYPGTFGGFGGGMDDAFCDTDEVVTAMQTSLTPGNQVLNIRFTCTSLLTGETRRVNFGGNGVFDTIRKTKLQTCPDGEVANGVRINSGDHVNAVGLHCGTFQANVVAQPTPAPQPAPAPAALPTGFAGVWDAVTSQGGVFTLILEVNGNQVSGYFGHANAQYDGTLTGVMDVGGRKFGYSYVQPQIGGSGNGMFELSADGQSMSGPFVTDQDMTQRYTWTAKRRP